jgi:hypothetical protein
VTSSRKIAAVWFLLIAATLLSWRVGTGSAPDAGGGRTLSTLAIFLVAGVKVRLVGLWFMELREAVTPLRLAFEVYVLAVFAMMIGLYLAGG